MKSGESHFGYIIRLQVEAESFQEGKPLTEMLSRLIALCRACDFDPAQTAYILGDTLI